MSIRACILVLIALMGALAGFHMRGPARASNAGVLAAGAIHNCLLTDDGGVKCWGDGRFGQLGSQNAQGCAAAHIPCSRVPVDVDGLTDGVAALAAGADHNCALTEEGEVWCWGENASGQLGSETTDTCAFDVLCSVAPVEVSGLIGTMALAAGAAHTCALDASGGASCWGRNASGQLGDGTTTSRSARAAVPTGDERFVAMAAGGDHTCALSDTGAVRCWGSNLLGQLGIETDERCGSAGNIPCSRLPLEVPGLESGVAAIAAGGTHTCALTDAGGLLCWGGNAFGQLGDGTTVHRSAPAGVPGLATGVAAVAAGDLGQHTCVVTVQGGAKCWGDNGLGQLGAPSSDGCGIVGGLLCSTIPLDVSGLGEGVTAIAPGGAQTCALVDGRIMCWGRNDRGQLAADSAESCAFDILCSTTPIEALGFDPKVTPTACPTTGCPTATAVPTSTPTATAVPTSTPTSPSTGTAVPTSTPTSPSTATARPSLPGDINCDFAVTAVDAALILQLEAGLIGPASLACVDAGDVNGDGVAGAIDAALILQFTANLLRNWPP